MLCCRHERGMQNVGGRLTAFLFSIFLKFDQKNKKALICRTFSSWENKAWAKANNTNLHDGMLRKYTPEQIDFAWRLHTGAILKSARN